MLIKTNGIVLSKLKYRDNDLIVKCYTNQRGVVSYLLRGVLKSKRGSAKTAYFQPLSQLQIEENYRANQSLQYISDVKLNIVYQSLHSNILKSSIVMFLSEVLSSVLKEEERNDHLYDYLETSLVWLDHEDDFTNFHLLFLLNLTRYLGFYPDVSTVENPFFNLKYINPLCMQSINSFLLIISSGFGLYNSLYIFSHSSSDIDSFLVILIG